MLQKTSLFYLIILVTVSLLSSIAIADTVFSPRMNQIQVIGTHNSYHKRPKYISWAKNVTKAVQDWDYEHLPLDVQLENGVRSLEIDIHNTPEGWKVMHAPYFDNETTCATLQECLKVVQEWSDKNPWHVPIIIMIERKTEGPVLDKRITNPKKEDIERIEEDILSAIPRDKIITPDLIRGDCKTLEEAVLTKGWPKLEEVRGKILFIFHNRWELREFYLDGHPNLEGRLMFVNSRPGDPFSATVIIDNPFHPDIPEWVKKGYLVRVFGGDPKTDDMETVRMKDEKAFSCGAHVISTDNPPGEVHTGTGYFAIFPEGSTVRWNPINGPINVDIWPEPKNSLNKQQIDTK